MIKFIKKLLSYEFIKFCIVGGINTLMGGILIPYIARLIMHGSPSFYGIDLSLAIGYLVWFTFAYLIQVKFVFNSHFEWKRYLIYPFTQIPNYLLNTLFLYLFEDLAHLPSFIALALAAVAAVPIMFVLVRLVVKTKKTDEKRI